MPPFGFPRYASLGGFRSLAPLARSNAALRVPSLGSARRLCGLRSLPRASRRKPRSLLNEACSLGFRLKHGLRGYTYTQGTL